MRARAGSQVGSFQRSSSTINIYSHTKSLGFRSDTPLMPVNFVESDDRTVSRGRQQESRHYHGERSHSAKSTFPEVPRSRFPSLDRNLCDEIIAFEGTISPSCPVHGAQHQPSGHMLEDFVSIEGHVSENCPVHGSNSRPPHDRRRTDSTQRRMISTPGHFSEPGISMFRHESKSQRKPSRCEATHRHSSNNSKSTRRQSLDRRHSAQRQSSDHRESISYEIHNRHDSISRNQNSESISGLSPEQYSHSKHFVSARNSKMYSGSVKTIATSVNSPAAPVLQYGPITPKAMVLVPEKDLVPIPNELAALDHSPQPVMDASQLNCRDQNTVEPRIHRPKSAVW